MADSESRNLAMGEPAAMRSLELLGTSLGRARCMWPAQLDRMRASLVSHGQLTPVVAVERVGRLELIDAGAHPAEDATQPRALPAGSHLAAQPDAQGLVRVLPE